MTSTCQLKDTCRIQQKVYSTIQCLQGIHFTGNKSHRLKMKKMEIDTPYEGNPKKQEYLLSYLTSRLQSKIKQKSLGRSFHTAQGKIQQRDVTRRNIYDPHMGAINYIKESLLESQLRGAPVQYHLEISAHLSHQQLGGPEIIKQRILELKNIINQ